MKFLSCLILILLISYQNSIAKGNPPNILFIMVDDLGWSDLGFMGSDYYETPNIDKLAKESMVFMHAYAGAANCAPSRAALMSGMSAPRTGVYTVQSSERGDARTRRIIPIKNITQLDNDLYTMADMLHDAGYVTGNFGKWHLGMSPLSQGFDVNVGGSDKGHPKCYFAPFVDPIIPADTGAYLTDCLTDNVIRFIEDNKGTPFFAYLPYYTVHTPIQAKGNIIAKYAKKKGSRGQHNPKYAAMVETLDTNVGRVLDCISNLGIDDNTLIILTSDNGGVYGITEQQPLRAGKGSYYEGGIRVPLTIKWGDNIKPRTEYTPVSHLDFFPTLAEVVGREDQIGHVLDGKSLWGLIARNEEMDNRPLIFHFPIYLAANTGDRKPLRDPLFRTRPGSTIRMGEWKLHRYYEDGEIELYNLLTDPSEKTNVAEANVQLRDSLLTVLDLWIKDTNALIPTQKNTAFDPTFERRKLESFR